ncbi:MAG: C4-dicarboxylate ABC transporter, partial [Gemmatimonadetes bacterium]|nr:C4-dicarboxylate ABC transporter [Gemmatimonadota bacterium]
MEFGALSLLPPLLAIALAIWTRQVYLSLAAGVWLGWTLLAGWNPLAGAAAAIEAAVVVLGDAGNARVILFTLVIGAVIATIEASGGVRGFVDWLEHRRWVASPRAAQLLAWSVGVVIFIESNITVLVAGAISRPLFDRYRVSREKLAYLIDSTSAPICVLIPLNAWGAYILGILGGLGVAQPLTVMVEAIAFNFYAIFAALLAAATAIWGLNFGGMRRAEARVQEGVLLRPGSVPAVDTDVIAPPQREGVVPRARNMVLPIVALVGIMPLGLYVTGEGDITAGSGSTSVLWAVLGALAVAWLLLLGQRMMGIGELTRIGLRGAGGLVGLALILLLALALGNVTRELGTGVYVAAVVQGIFPPLVLLPLIFVVAAGIAFSTGTSWGTFAIMLPISVPLAAALGLPLAPFLAASLSGGIFGDHASPISDTTIIASMAAAVDHIDHVRTQLPYA